MVVDHVSPHPARLPVNMLVCTHRDRKKRNIFKKEMNTEVH